MTNTLAEIDAAATAQLGSPEHAVMVRRAGAAIEAATAVENLSRIRGQWDGIAAYVAKARNFEIRSTAEEIKARAERTLGQMLLQRGDIVGFNEGTRSKTGFPSAVVPTNSHLTPFPSVVRLSRLLATALSHLVEGKP
jgi:hypothetical protein